MPDRCLPTSFRRKISAVLLGIVYGGSVVNGVHRGMDFVLKSETGLSEWPVVAALVSIAASGLAAFLAAYSAQFLGSGLLSLGFLLPLSLLPLFLSDAKDLGVFAAIVGAIIGIGFGIYATRLPLAAADVEKGRLFGVRWGHWLWLWLPWQLSISNVVWFVAPLSLLGKPTPWVWDLSSVWALSGDVIRTPVTLLLLGYSMVKALDSIRHDAPWSRGQAALRFLGWFLLFPIVVNLIRFGGFL